MSKENVKKFIQDTHEKPELKKILEKPKADFDSKEAKMEYVAKEAKKYGYNFTASDMKAVLEDHDSGLSDDDLSNVAGGGVVREGASYVADKAKKFWKWFW